MIAGLSTNASVVNQAQAYLPRQMNKVAAGERLARQGAKRLEPAWVQLWSAGIAHAGQGAKAWLLAHPQASRGLLWPHALSFHDSFSELSAEELVISNGECPTFADFEKLWLWERLAKPKHWSLRVKPEPIHAVMFPLWLGYRAPRNEKDGIRLVVLSGVSGEIMPSLKSVVLASLQQNSQKHKTS